MCIIFFSPHPPKISKFNQYLFIGSCLNCKRNKDVPKGTQADTHTFRHVAPVGEAMGGLGLKMSRSSEIILDATSGCSWWKWGGMGGGGGEKPVGEPSMNTAWKAAVSISREISEWCM